METKITLTGLLLAATLLSQDTNAQQSPFRGHAKATIERIASGNVPHHSHYYTHVQQAMPSAQKTTTNQYSLVATKYATYNGGFVNSDTTLYSYSNGRMGTWMGDMNYDNAITMAYDAGGTIYDFNNRRAQTFDANGHITERLYENWDNVNFVYTPFAHDIYIYNSNGQLTDMQYQLWDATLAQPNWDNDTLYQFAYDTVSGQVLTMEGKTWNDTGGYWNVSFRYVYTYDVSGNLIMETLQSWNQPTTSYNNVSRYKYLYNSGRMINAVYQTYNAGTANWTSVNQTNYTYNTSGWMTEATMQNWNNGFNTWENDMRYAYTYDTDGDVLTEVGQSWDGSGNGVFNNMTRTSMTYDTTTPDNHMPMLVETESWSNGAWGYDNNSTQTRLFFNEIISNVKNVTKIDANVFPSPAADHINIQFNWNKPETVSMAIYDAQGRIAKQWTDNVSGQYSKKIAVTELPSGTYWVKIVGSTAVSNKQIVIIH